MDLSFSPLRPKLAVGLALALTLVLPSCRKCLKGNRDVSIREIATADIPSYTDVSSPLVMDVKLKQGSKSVMFEGEINLISTLYLDHTGSEIKFASTEDCIDPRKPLTAYVINSSFHKLTLGGTGDITGDSLDFDPQIELLGTGNVDLDGVSAEQFIELKGTGNVDLEGMPTLNADVDISGTGDVYVWCTGTLTVNISGTGNVYYKGSPVVISTVTGTGQVLPR